MQKLMFSAALAALLVSPALAQEPPHINRGNAYKLNQPGGPQSGAPHQPGPGNRPDHGNHGGPRPAPGAPQAATPPAPPQGHPQGGNGGNWHGNRDDHGDRGGNRGDHGDRGGNRPGFNPGDHTRPTPGFGNRPGGRPNYSNFSRYHQAYRANRRFHAGSYHRPAGWYYRRWSFGQVLPSIFWAQQYWLNDYMAYDLPPPPPGAVWVRYGDDALLIDRYSGEIITVEYGVFY